MCTPLFVHSLSMGMHARHSPLPMHALGHATGTLHVPSIWQISTPLPEHRLLIGVHATHCPFPMQAPSQPSPPLVTKSGPHATDCPPAQNLSPGFFPSHSGATSRHDPGSGAVLSQSCFPGHKWNGVHTWFGGVQMSTTFCA